MNQAIRSVRTQSPTILSSTSSRHQFGQKSSVIRFRQVTTVSSNSDRKLNMDKTEHPDDKSNEDVMSHSFGEGYATRSDEEGFGGICGGNQTMPKVDIDKKIHENHPAYDKTQGSEVKEKEKARHQTNANA